eukprot:Sspe_Gene.3475::Locus_1155_Transcript_2_3_Confidence_0.500_Length_1868::g.3475::m.3475
MEVIVCPCGEDPVTVVVEGHMTVADVKEAAGLGVNSLLIYGDAILADSDLVADTGVVAECELHERPLPTCSPLAASDSIFAAITPDATGIAVWGMIYSNAWNSFSTVIRAPEDTSFLSVDCGGFDDDPFVATVTSAGEVLAYSLPGCRALPCGPFPKDTVAVTCGFAHIVVLRKNGALHAKVVKPGIIAADTMVDQLNTFDEQVVSAYAKGRCTYVVTSTNRIVHFGSLHNGLQNVPSYHGAVVNVRYNGASRAMALVREEGGTAVVNWGYPEEVPKPTDVALGCFSDPYGTVCYLQLAGVQWYHGETSGFIDGMFLAVATARGMVTTLLPSRHIVQHNVDNDPDIFPDPPKAVLKD